MGAGPPLCSAPATQYSLEVGAGSEAAARGGAAASGAMYEVLLRRSGSGAQLGVQLRSADGGAALEVINIRPGGVVDEWNRRAPNDRVIWLGDLIVEANGVRGDAQRVDAELGRGGDLRLRLRRPEEEQHLADDLFGGHGGLGLLGALGGGGGGARGSRGDVGGSGAFGSQGALGSHGAGAGAFGAPAELPGFREDEDMIYIACEIGGTTAEMMVDTGAQMSVVSAPVVRRLGLTGHMDRSEQGVAAGVGRAAILGKLRNVPVVLGEGVDFLLDLSVLGIDEEMLMLGLDQLRRFRCLVDCDNRCLVFNGKGGAVVPFLPPDPTRKLRRAGCPVM